MNKQMLLKTFGLLLSFTISHLGLSQASDNSIDIIPYWKKDESHAVKIKTTTTDLDLDNGKTQTFQSTFDANFKVLEASDAGFKVEWTYSSAKLADNESVIETLIIAKLTNVKMLISLSDIGRFIELVNANDVRTAANKVLDELIKNSASDPEMNSQYKVVRQLISSKQGLETILLKHLKIYHFSFGSNYKFNHVYTNNIKFPSPMGGQPFDAVEKIRLTKLDRASSTCVIETSKTIDGNAVKTAVKNHIKSVSNEDPKTIDEQVGKADLEIAESTVQQLDFSKGILQKSSFKRIMNLGFQNRTAILEIETVN